MLRFRDNLGAGRPEDESGVATCEMIGRERPIGAAIDLIFFDLAAEDRRGRLGSANGNRTRISALKGVLAAQKPNKMNTLEYLCRKNASLMHQRIDKTASLQTQFFEALRTFEETVIHFNCTSSSSSL